MRNVTVRRIWAKTVAVGKEYYILCVFVAFSTQHARCIHHLVICGLSSSTFSTLPHNGTISEKTLLDIKCVSIFSLKCLKHFSF